MIKDTKTAKQLAEIAKKSPNIGKRGKRKTTLALEKALEKKAEQIVNDMLIERSRMINNMPSKLKGAKYRDLVDGVDKFIKNIQLLTGKNTSRIGMGAWLAEEIEKENNQDTNGSEI